MVKDEADDEDPFRKEEVEDEEPCQDVYKGDEDDEDLGNAFISQSGNFPEEEDDQEECNGEGEGSEREGGGNSLLLFLNQ